MRRPIMPTTIRAAAIVGLLHVAACVNTTEATLAYAPTGTAAVTMAPAAAIASVTSQDQRREAPQRLGTVMGGYGQPIKILNTTRPVGEEVAEVFRQALQRRGLLRQGVAAPYRINVIVRRFDSDQYIGLGARSDMTMQVLDATGRVAYEDTATTSRSLVRFFQSGIFGSVDDMRALAESVLAEAVDKLLDNPAFRAAVQGGAAGPFGS